MPAGIHFHVQNNGTLILSFARFLGVLRLRPVERNGRRNAATNAENAAAKTAAFAGTESGAFTRANTAARTRTDTAAEPGPFDGGPILASGSPYWAMLLLECSHPAAR